MREDDGTKIYREKMATWEEWSRTRLREHSVRFLIEDWNIIVRLIHYNWDNLLAELHEDFYRGNDILT